MGCCGAVASNAENPLRLNAPMARESLQSKSQLVKQATSEAWKEIAQPRVVSNL